MTSIAGIDLNGAVDRSIVRQDGSERIVRGGVPSVAAIEKLMCGRCRSALAPHVWRFAQVRSSDRRCHVIEPQSREFSRDVTT